MSRRPLGALDLALAPLALAGLVLALPATAGWHFTEVTEAAGVATLHGYVGGLTGEPRIMSGGAAAGDVDGDGFPDLFVLTGDLGPTRFFHNRGDGTFEERGAAVGLALSGGKPSGAVFADVDGDGALDLLVGGIEGSSPRLFRNRGDGTFEEATGGSGLASSRDTWSGSLADYDGDGDLDLTLGHWWAAGGGVGHLWQNQGAGHFVDVGVAAGVSAAFSAIDYSFTPSFADLDSDGWPDLLVAADFGSSRVFRNLANGSFDEQEGQPLTDENGMGSAVGDYDNDGDLDWFVSSIWDPDQVPQGNWGVTGNRLYRNRGDGTLEDATGSSGLRQGYWGWGSCFGDFDHDGHLDLFHVNGFSVDGAEEFHHDPARFFHADGDGTFTERGAELGVADTGQGRGVVCFDYDRDGDLDLFVANNSGPARLFRNDGGNARHWLGVRLRGRSPNTWAVGARVWVTTAAGTQMRELAAGSHFLSASPTEAHFGLGDAALVELLRVRFPDGSEISRVNVPADQLLELSQVGAGATEVPALGLPGAILLAAALLVAGLRRLAHKAS